jgi:hypothetical protein
MCLVWQLVTIFFLPLEYRGFTIVSMRLKNIGCNLEVHVQIMQIEVFCMQISSRMKKYAISLCKLPRGCESEWNLKRILNGKVS